LEKLCDEHVVSFSLFLLRGSAATTRRGKYICVVVVVVVVVGVVGFEEESLRFLDFLPSPP
jgi:hypothetical protein